ncbi:MAG: hypothetical protein ACLFM8_04630 [Halobacteriales archaeon]
MSDPVPFGRRAVLAAMAAGATVGIAGCLGDDPTPADFAYPDGFAVDGLDVDAAVGPTSAMADLEALALETAHGMDAAFGTTREHLDGRFDRTGERFVVDRRRIDETRGRVLLSTQFFDGVERIERRKVEPRSIEYDYRASEHAYDPVEDPRLGVVGSLIESVDLTATDVASGGDRVVYTADESAIPPSSRIGELAASVGSLEAGAVRPAIDEHSLVHDATVSATLASDSGGSIEIEMTWTYGSFDDAAVEPPAWLAEVPDRARPVVDLRIEEVPGRQVEVHVDRFEHARQLLVVVDGEGVVDGTDRAGVVTVPAGTYTDEEGAVRDVQVFVADRLRGPRLIRTHVPTPVDR